MPKFVVAYVRNGHPRLHKICDTLEAGWKEFDCFRTRNPLRSVVLMEVDLDLATRRLIDSAGPFTEKDTVVNRLTVLR